VAISIPGVMLQLLPGWGAFDAAKTPDALLNRELPGTSAG